jgi:YggT family protein
VLLVWQLAYLLLYLFLFVLLGRLVAEYVLVFARRWRPGRAASAALEVVYSTTDPPLKALRRVIPPLRIGSVSLDLGFLLLLMIVVILMSVVQRLAGQSY